MHGPDSAMIPTSWAWCIPVVDLLNSRHPTTNHWCLTNHCFRSEELLVHGASGQAESYRRLGCSWCDICGRILDCLPPGMITAMQLCYCGMIARLSHCEDHWWLDPNCHLSRGDRLSSKVIILNMFISLCPLPQIARIWLTLSWSKEFGMLIKTIVQRHKVVCHCNWMYAKGPCPTAGHIPLHSIHDCPCWGVQNNRYLRNLMSQPI